MHRIVAISSLLLAPLLTLIVAYPPIHLEKLSSEGERFVTLLSATVSLAFLASLVALPIGTVLGILLERAALRGRGLLQVLLTLALFTPLPVTAVAWQVVLGTWLPPLTLPPGEVAWRPWNQGLLPAALVHAFAAVPWVTAIVQAGLRRVDVALEEEALASGGPRFVLRHVVGPKLMLAMLAAGAWIGTVAFREIPVTDAMMVRTFAEEVYTQIVGRPEGIAAAVAVTLPVVLSAALMATVALSFAVRRWAVSAEPPRRGRTLLKSGGTPLAWGLVAVVVLLPLSALLWKAGGGGATDGGSIAFAVGQVRRVVSLNATVLVQTLLTALAAGSIAAAVATLLAWSARDRAGRRTVVLIVVTLLALTPGPLIGFGLKQLIFHLIDIEAFLLMTLNVTMDFPPLRSALYDQPSPLPYLLACVLRSVAIAMLIVAPAVRSVPRDLVELAVQDGGRVWRRAGWPLLRRPFVLAALAAAGVSLGEVSAGKLVLPPGGRIFILDLFDQMHYGAESTVAAMALVQVALALPVAVAFSKEWR